MLLQGAVLLMGQDGRSGPALPRSITSNERAERLLEAGMDLLLQGAVRLVGRDGRARPALLCGA